MGKLVVVALRAVLVVLFAGAVFVQAVIVPLLAIDMRDLDPDAAHLRTPFLVIVVLGVVTVQVVLVCVWRLVTMVRRGTVFSPAAFRYVDVMIGAVAAAAAAARSCSRSSWRPATPSRPGSSCSSRDSAAWSRASRSSCSCCGCCWPRPSPATPRRRTCGPSWTR